MGVHSQPVGALFPREQYLRPAGKDLTSVNISLHPMIRPLSRPRSRLGMLADALSTEIWPAVSGVGNTSVVFVLGPVPIPGGGFGRQPGQQLRLSYRNNVCGPLAQGRLRPTSCPFRCYLRVLTSVGIQRMCNRLFIVIPCRGPVHGDGFGRFPVPTQCTPRKTALAVLYGIGFADALGSTTA